MKGIIDRLEGNFAVVELDNRRMENIPLTDLPPGVREGDALELKNGVWQRDPERTDRLKTEIEKLASELFE